MNIEVKITKKPVDYKESIILLEKRANDVFLGKKKELLWILEHNTVYTAGSSASEKDVLNKEIEIIKTNRGGKHTLHSPGQKVIYFVLNLNKRGKNIRKLVRKIEKCIIEVLKEFEIVSIGDNNNIGVWINRKNSKEKIGAIGIKVRKWIAYHGFTINVSNDLKIYNNINPCGIKNLKLTSLKNLGVKNFGNINQVIIDKFLSIFQL